MKSKMIDHKQELIETMKVVAHRHGIWTVFTDFLELSAISISNAIDHRQKEDREARYLETIKKYNSKEIEIFPKMLAELTMALESDPSDILGSVFTELELSNKWRGQFFTPMSICNAIGEMVIEGVEEAIEKNGYATVSEPACGGGAIIIGLANALRKKGINYQRKLLVTAVDIDIRSVYMAYIQLSLLGIPAVVVHGNTLTVEEYSSWYTPMYVLGGWAYKHYWEKEKQKEKELPKVININRSEKEKLEKAV